LRFCADPNANTLLFPLAVGVRFFERLRFGPAQAHSNLGHPSRVANAVLGGVYGLEARLLRHVSMPFGLSVLVVARRTAAVGKRCSSTL
jgi:hypothetical protein